MKWFKGLLYALILLLVAVPMTTFALDQEPSIVITELQTTGDNGSTDNEFVEIFNTSSKSVDLSNWKLQYASSTSTSWINKATLSGILYPGGRLLLASNNYLTQEADFSFSPGFKMEAGHIRLVKPSSENTNQIEVVDLLGWGTALYAETAPASYAPAGQSIERKLDDQDLYIDTNNNKDDFYLQTYPSPLSDNLEPLVEEDSITQDEEQADTSVPSQESENEETEVVNEEEVADETPSNTDSQTDPDKKEEARPVTYSELKITELMPNPAPPLTDEDDEFIEIYNPNTYPVSLAGYQIQTGNSYNYKYTFESGVISPGSYLVVYSKDSGLTLANSSGQARILDPAGNIVDETDPYDTAKDGQSWTYYSTSWTWTTQPTPGFSNVLVMPLAKSTSGSSAKSKAKKAATKKAATKKSATKKKSTAKKTAKPKAKKAKKDKQAAEIAAYTQTNDGDSNNMQPWILAGVGVLAVGYALYEYKDDLANKYRQLRGNSRSRPKARQAA